MPIFAKLDTYSNKFINSAVYLKTKFYTVVLLLRIFIHHTNGSSNNNNNTHCNLGVPRRQPHCRSGLATLPSVGAVP